MKPLDKLFALKSDTAAGRIDYCRVMLSVHGFLPAGEDVKVKQRIDKWLKEHGVEKVDGGKSCSSG